jgi:hypothetical protein
MGISAKNIKRIYREVERIGVPWENLKMGELGSQRLHGGGSEGEEWEGFRNSKAFFKSKGVEHISFDINNKWDSLYIDLSKLHDKWNDYFDIVTNFGTSEHVQNGQYQVFKNIHNFTKKGGIMINYNPVVGRIQRGHPVKTTVYYEEDFHEKLAKLNGYELIEKDFFRGTGRKSKGGNIICVLRKINDDEFCSEKDFWQLGGIIDYTKNNSLTQDRLKYEKEADHSGTGDNS